MAEVSSQSLAPSTTAYKEVIVQSAGQFIGTMQAPCGGSQADWGVQAWWVGSLS